MAVPDIGKPLIHLHSVNSTNVYLTELAAKGEAPEGTVILADHQTQGKGQGGNGWFSDSGINLLFSLMINPTFLMAERQFYLSMSISNGLAAYIESVARPVAIKWPNDLLLNTKKTAGILIENTVAGNFLKSSIIGIGLNVNQQVFPPSVPNPNSLSLACGKTLDLAKAMADVLASLQESMKLLFNQQYGLIRTMYLNRLWRLNEWAEYTDASGRFEGRIADVADSGELMVVLRNGKIKQYGFKEIAC
ncbi:MAG: biotin--[acetyl-CoA-carboxylase] ligase [Bacteroidales bacterium]|nr:biotin--[acetyl-CoA-carboxylase] ligase [Bacteroidales bacterium]